MHNYQITLTTKDGKRISDSIKATSSFDAKKVMQVRYPGCSIWNIKEEK